jgi:hypothetical protein
MGTNHNLFRQTVLQKCGRVNNFSLENSSLVEYLKNSNSPQSNQNSAALWRIFSANKSASTYRKKGFYTNRDPKQAGGWIHFCLKRLRTLKFFQIVTCDVKKIKKRLVSFSRPIQCYHSHADPIWPDGTF